MKMIIIIMKKSQEMTVFSGRQNFDFRYETKVRIVMVDFKFDALYRYVFMKASRSWISRKVIRKFVLVAGALCAIST